MREIGKNIRDLRQRCQLTQEELAQKLHVTRQTVSNYEMGKSRPDVEMICSLAQVLGVDANAVIYGPPVLQDRKKAARRLAVEAAGLLLLALATAWLHHWGRELMQQRLMLTIPLTLADWLLLPLVCFLLGGWLMAGVYLVLQPKPFVRPWYRAARRGIMILVCVCFAILVPYLVYFGIGDLEFLRKDAVNLSFPYIPVYADAAYFLMMLNGKFPAVYGVFGALAYLFRDCTRGQEETL